MKRLLYWLIVFAFLAALLPAIPAQAQATEIVKPTAHTVGPTAGGTVNNPEFAYDGTTGGDNTTRNRLGVGDNNADPTIEYHTWQDPSYTHTARRLYVRRSGTENIDDTWGIYFSTNGGSTYTPIEEGLTNPAEGNTTAVTIAPGLNLSNLWVKILTSKTGKSDGEFADIWDVWLEGDYTPGDITNTPDNYAFGTVAEGSTNVTGLTYFTVTNNSTSAAVNITIRGSDMTGGVPWTLSDTATQGPDTYGLKAGTSDTGDYTITVTSSGVSLKDGLPATSSIDWGLQLLAPTSFSDGASKSGTVTLTATQA